MEEDDEASWLNLDASSAISSWTHQRSVREQNKSLRRVYEEAEMVYGRDVHDHGGFFVCFAYCMQTSFSPITNKLKKNFLKQSKIDDLII
jgi:hypothetical protein